MSQEIIEGIQAIEKEKGIEEGVLIGGPSIAVDPEGKILVETTDRMAVVTLDSEVVRQARVDYPGYLPIRAQLYAKAWAELAATDGLPAD